MFTSLTNLLARPAVMALRGLEARPSVDTLHSVPLVAIDATLAGKGPMHTATA